MSSPQKLVWPPTGFLADVGELPDQAAPLLPALLSRIVSAGWPEAEIHPRACALVVTLARRAGLHGAVPLSKRISTTETALQWCLRILLVSYPNEQAASAAFAAAVSEASDLPSYPEDTPHRTRRHHGTHEDGPAHQRESPDPPRPENGFSPLRAASEAVYAPALATHRLVQAEVFAVTYAVPRTARYAASIIAAATAVARSTGTMPTAEALSALPPQTLATLAVVSSPVDRALLATEELCTLLLAEGPKVRLALRACRTCTPMLEGEELNAWLEGQIPLVLNGVTICHRPNNTPTRQGNAQATRTCRRCGKHVPQNVTWPDHHASTHCRKN